MSSNKPWERPWSMEEIIENSDKWNLAGDVALLNTLKSFADKLIDRSTEINNNVSNLTKNLDETSLRLGIAQNEFQSLRNSQFIESRVYEDDETLPQSENGEKQSEEVRNESDRTDDIKAAAMKGLQVLEQYFEKVEVSVSDSEDEDSDLPNYILRARDLYMERPLPYVIGSAEWHKSWHVGLEESSDSETEKASDKFSESDDDSRLQDASDASSELDFSRAEPKPTSSDSEPISPERNFAEELAAKLGDVIGAEVNTRPIRKQPNYADLFFDEPPPLDENRGLFSGGAGLFDDDDEFATPGDASPKPEKKTSDDRKPSLPLFADEPPALIDEKKKPVGGVSIFGSANLFDKKLLKRQPSSDDEEIEETIEKPAKKVDLFGDDDDLFKTKEENNYSERKKINLFESDEEKEETSEKDVKKMSLFDDDDDLFKNDLFSNVSTNPKKQFSSALFDDVEDQIEDIFSSDKTEKNEPKPTRNLFEDFMAIPDNNNSIQNAGQTHDLFGDGPGKQTQDETKAPRISLFDSPPPERDDLFGDEKPNEPEIPKNPPFSSSTPEAVTSAANASIRLFDPSPPPDDDWDAKSETLSETDLTDHEDVSCQKSSLFSEEPPSLDITSKKDSPEVEASPGKLRHNLKINVGALIPGCRPPKRPEGDSQSFDATDHVQVLHSVTKDRARVPALNRRPSTRRGRKAALQSSEIGFKLEKEVSEEVLFAGGVSSKVDEDLFGAVSPSEDFFGSKSSSEPPRSSDLFWSESSEPPPLEEKSSKLPQRKVDLFDDDDDEEDDIFSGKKASVQPTKKLKKSLFDDDDNDDEDIFKNSSVKKTESKLASEKKIPKMSSVKKLENTKPDDDPLSSALLK